MPTKIMLPINIDLKYIYDFYHKNFCPVQSVPVQDTNLDENRVTLAARALADKHVRLGRDRRERLADLCSTLAMREWDMRRSRKLDMLPDVLPALLKAGFADIVAGPEDMARKGTTRKEDGPGLYARKIADLREIRNEPRLRVLIVTGSRINDVKPLAELTDLQALD